MAIDVTAAAQTPQEVTSDGATVRARTIDDLIKADQNDKANQAQAKGLTPWQMLYPSRAVLPGSS